MNWKIMFEHALDKWNFIVDTYIKYSDIDGYFNESKSDHGMIEKYPHLTKYFFECSFCENFHSYKYPGDGNVHEDACKGCPLSDNGHNCQDKGSIWKKWDKKNKLKHAVKMRDLIKSLEEKYVKD